tara:strand:+ start:727 stop:3066 length:2340 start_codon:yes stop_codon:yes gene_type:complete
MATISTSFLSNIHPKIQEELFRKMDESLRGTQESQDVKACWAKMTSGAGGIDQEITPVVLMGGEMYNNRLREGFSENYDWSTSRDGELQFGQSISDTNGEVYRPQAGLTGIESSTDGSYGSLKKATVNWQCWSMNDLARLSKAFMTIGRSVMIEWGWSTSPGETLTYASSELNKAIREGKKRILENKGNYEVISGVVKNFSWSANAEGGFDCQTDIISHGTPMTEGGIGQDTNIQVPGGGTTEDGEALAALTALGFNNLQKYLNNIKLEIVRHLNPGTTIDDPWIGRDNVPGASVFEAKNVEIRDSALQFGSVTFVSWGYFEDNILSKYLGRVAKDSDVKYTFRSIDAIEDSSGNIKYESVKCSNHPDLETADSRVCQFPGQGGRHNSNFENFSVNSSKKEGYLRNIKLNVEFIKACFLDVDSLQAGMDKLFKGINDIAGNIFDFKIMADDCQTSNLRVVDLNVCENDVQFLLKNRSSTGNTNGLFYFPYMKSDNTIVRSQTLTAKVPNSSMYAAMYGSNKVKITQTDPVRMDDGGIEALAEQMRDGKIVDKFLGGFGVPDAKGNNYGNLDGRLPEASGGTINVAGNLGYGAGPPLVEGATLEGTMEVMSNKEKEADAAENAEKEDKGFFEAAWDWASDAASYVVDKISEGVEYLYRATQAALSEYDMGEIKTSFQIAQMIKEIQYDGDDPVIYNTDFVLPLELSLTIDGTGGIFPGNAFSTDYIPEDYKPHSHPEVKTHMKGAVFMVKGISHSVSADGWTTSFDGIMRASIPPPPKKK